MDLRTFALKLHLCPGIGIKTEYMIWQCLREIKSFETIEILCERAKLSERISKQLISHWNSSEHLALVKKHLVKCQFMTIFDDDYPEALRQIYCPPMVLFYRGDLSLLHQKMIGIVGARKNTTYGKQVLENLIPSLVQNSICIVSGLATGIDGISHRITLDHGGKTIGVIGTGIDRQYPKHHQDLQKQLKTDGLVLSEYPLGSPPMQFHFPQRNRIIAGLCQSLAVIEAKQKSGSLITASLALQENRNVLAVPGRIDAPMSLGCNELIAAGAMPILNAESLISNFFI